MKVAPKMIHAITGIDALKKKKNIIFMAPKIKALNAMDRYPSL